MKPMRKGLAYGLAIVLFAALVVWALFFTIDTPRYDMIFAEKTMLLQALWHTLYISVITLICSIVFGFVLFLMLQSEHTFIRAVAVVFREMMMGTPLLVMVFLGVYVVGELVQMNNKEVLGILALTLYMAPYLANAFESAKAVIDDDQYTVMAIYHFNKWQQYRYVILPQMIKPLIPSIINNLSSIIKGSALLKIVSVSEISYVLTVISSKNWAAIEGYYVMWLAYLMITIPLSLLAQFIGKKVSAQ